MRKRVGTKRKMKGGIFGCTGPKCISVAPVGPPPTVPPTVAAPVPAASATPLSSVNIIGERWVSPGYTTSYKNTSPHMPERVAGYYTMSAATFPTSTSQFIKIPTYVSGTNKKRIMFETKEFSLEIGIGDCITFKKEGTASKPDTNIYTAKVVGFYDTTPISEIRVKLYNSDTHRWSDDIEDIPLPNNGNFGGRGTGLYNTIVKLDKCPEASEIGLSSKTVSSVGGRRKHTHKKSKKSKRKTHRKRR